MTNEDLWTTVFAIGAVQGTFLIAVLMARQDSRRRAPRALAGLITAFTLMVAAAWAQQVVSPPLEDLIALLNINTELAIGPFLLLFTQAVLDPERRWTRRVAVQFLPLALAYGAATFLWVAHGYGQNGPTLDALGLRVQLYVLAKFTFLVTYVVLSVNTLNRGLRLAPRSVAARRRSELLWLRGWYLVLTVVPAIIYGAEFAGWFGIRTLIDPDPFGCLLLTGTIYLGTLMLLVRPTVLSLRAAPTSGQWATQADRVIGYLERERPWLEPELTLDRLAEGVGLTVNRLSAVLNEGLDTTFYRLLNRYRLAEFERLAKDPRARSRSVLDLAFDAGFNSKASFYRAFRETHDTTPSAFRKGVQTETES